MAGSDQPGTGATGATGGGAVDPTTTGGGTVDSAPLAPLVDNAAVYLPEDLGPVTITLTAPDAAALADIETNDTDAKTAVSFSATDYGGAQGNGTVELRGSTSRFALQKSYQIKLADDSPAWRGGRVINLLKHPYDLTRVRNTLSYELFRSVSNLTSLRTGFVHLVINGVDRGLYEWVEEPDEVFLAAHGLDPKGSIYKAVAFSFEPIDDATAADPAKVDEIVASKGKKDLAKLRRMLAAVNDSTQPINDVIAHYFDRDNYMTWLAVNVLTANFDTGSQNFMIYSPSDREGWYFLPWDYDGAWGWYEQPSAVPRSRWRAGLANWWWVGLHRRFLSEPANLAALDARIAELASTTFNDDRVAPLLARYHDVVAPFIAAQPDINNLPCDTAGTPAAIPAWETEYTRIGSNASRAYTEYQATRDRPMPFWLYSPAFYAAGVTLSWSASAQLHGQPVSYDVEVNAAETFDPASTMLNQAGLGEPKFTTAALPRGKYFWRVVARAASNPANDWQMAFNDHFPVDVP